MTGTTLCLAVLLVGMLGVATSGFERPSEGLSEGKRTSDRDGGEGSTTYPPLRWAILEGDLRKVRRLVAAGEDVDQPLFNGETAAMMAGRAEYWNITRYLLEQGSDPAAENALGDSLAAIARTSRLHPKAPEYRDLEAVREILRREGLY